MTSLVIALDAHPFSWSIGNSLSQLPKAVQALAVMGATFLLKSASNTLTVIIGGPLGITHAYVSPSIPAGVSMPQASLLSANELQGIISRAIQD